MELYDDTHIFIREKISRTNITVKEYVDRFDKLHKQSSRFTECLILLLYGWAIGSMRPMCGYHDIEIAIPMHIMDIDTHQ